MKQNTAVIGSTGFIGRGLVEKLIQTKNFRLLTLVSRTIKEDERNLNNNVLRVKCDVLNQKKLKQVLRNQDIVFFTAGLGWQHTGRSLSKIELLIEQIVQNVFSPYFVASTLHPNQRLVVLSTNAIDVMLGSLFSSQRNALEYETDEFVECLFSQNLSGNKEKKLKKVVWNLIVNHIMFSFVPALDYSYAFSKYLGEKTLRSLARKNIKILRISDVYGKGQDVSYPVINPKVRARRIQRFVAAYNLISKKSTGWIRSKNHGFIKDSETITQEIRNDSVFPTYIDDVIQMILTAASMNTEQMLFEATGVKISNKKMAETIKDFFQVKVKIVQKNSKSIFLKEKSKDRRILLGSRQATSFREGLQKWLG